MARHPGLDLAAFIKTGAEVDRLVDRPDLPNRRTLSLHTVGLGSSRLGVVARIYRDEGGLCVAGI
jgi:hypothetical protein